MNTNTSNNSTTQLVKRNIYKDIQFPADPKLQAAVNQDIHESVGFIHEECSSEINPMVFSYIPSVGLEHLDRCNCYRHTLRYFLESVWERAQAGSDLYRELDINDVLDYSIMRRSYKDLARKALGEAVSFLNQFNLVCPHIVCELQRTVDVFSMDYDLSQAKVRVVVQSILGYQCGLLESLKHFKESGIFSNNLDRQGNVIQRIHPNEDYRMRLNDRLIDAVKTLDDMIEGSKTRIEMNVNNSAISLDDLFSKVPLDSARYIEVESPEGLKSQENDKNT
jgi:hypothetical protein